MYFPVPHKASPHWTPPLTTKPHRFSHPETLYWITSKPFLMFAQYLGPCFLPRKMYHSQKCPVFFYILYTLYFSQVLFLIYHFSSSISSKVLSDSFQVNFPLFIPFLRLSLQFSCFLPSGLSSLSALSISHFPSWVHSSDPSWPCSVHSLLGLA